jgi:hypothetical protein
MRDLVHHLDLEEVVARAQASQLRDASLLGSFGHELGSGGAKPALVLGPFDVFVGARPAGDRKGRSLLHHLLELGSIERHRSLAPNSARNPLSQLSHEIVQLGLDLLEGEVGS